ncbi:uncharacterized protein LOC110691314 [Chenopodium quinoa]|uniref:UspA domain-containing protein n=1 Tax=Chenopodium quinoa TaxID=63459 RepID=A0A803MU03_CHEQI|nr:uncharacterized protein LOC110691314 [Chenopodium quinoa]
MVGMEDPAGTRKGDSRRVMVVADPTRESTAALQYALGHAIIEKDELILIHVTSPCPRKGRFSSHLSTFFRKHQFELSNATPNDPSKGGGGVAGGILGNSAISGIVFGSGGGIFGGSWVSDGNGGGKDEDFLKVMKKACETAYPKMKVQVEKVEQGCMDKATTILSQSKLLEIELLIVGQRRSLPNIFIGARKNGGQLLGGSKVVDTAEFLIENSLCTYVGVQKKSQNAGYLLNTRTHKNFWLLA